MPNSPLEKRHFATKEGKKLFAQEELILEVAESIWDELERRNLSKKQLAENLGCSSAYVTQILTGSRNMTLRTLADIATALDLHVDFSLSSAQQDNDWESGYNLFLGDVYPYVNAQQCNEQENDWTQVSTVKVA